MEFETVIERAEWETRRVAAAFGVNKWEKFTGEIELGITAFTGLIGEQKVTWAIRDGAGEYVGLGLTLLGVDTFDSYTSVVQTDSGHWIIGFEGERHKELMVRCLYRLGFEHGSVLSQLPSLSTHEKLELRLSMPREFWPQKWFDEEAR